MKSSKKSFSFTPKQYHIPSQLSICHRFRWSLAGTRVFMNFGFFILGTMESSGSFQMHLNSICKSSASTRTIPASSFFIFSKIERFLFSIPKTPSEHPKIIRAAPAPLGDFHGPQPKNGAKHSPPISSQGGPSGKIRGSSREAFFFAFDPKFSPSKRAPETKASRFQRFQCMRNPMVIEIFL